LRALQPSAPRPRNFAYPALLSGGWRNLAFEHFRRGLTIHWLVKGGEGEPSAALLAYAPGASVPRHRHAGLETIIVLEGTQSDENGDYAAGSLILNPAGTEHSVWTTTGCVVLIQWDLPVVFVGENE
jgi:anti-sigma factor ChrR (cupin superfamily)